MGELFLLFDPLNVLGRWINMAQLQWYPGHMAKTKRQIIEKLKLVDCVIELVDARAPLSSRNPMIDEIIKHKPRVIVMTKKDLANYEGVNKWISFFDKKGYIALAINAFNKKDLPKVIKASKLATAKILEKEISKGRQKRAIRAMILGIPNVGKSTLINQLIQKRVLTVGDRPGVTKNIQMIRIHESIELMDTPGILWPKFEDPEVGKKLALLGTLKDHLIPLDDIVIYGLHYLEKTQPENFEKRYEFKLDTSEIVQVFDGIGQRMGCFTKGREVDYDRVIDIFINDFNEGRLRKVMLDR